MGGVELIFQFYVAERCFMVKGSLVVLGGRIVLSILTFQLCWLDLILLNTSDYLVHGIYKLDIKN